MATQKNGLRRTYTWIGIIVGVILILTSIAGVGMAWGKTNMKLDYIIEDIAEIKEDIKVLQNGYRQTS